MLDTRCWIYNSTLSVNFNDIQYPETRIQDQSILSMVFIAAAKLDFKILCNYRVSITGMINAGAKRAGLTVSGRFR